MKYILKNKFYIFLISIMDFLGSIIWLPFRLFNRFREHVFAKDRFCLRSWLRCTLSPTDAVPESLESSRPLDEKRPVPLEGIRSPSFNSTNVLVNQPVV